MTAHSDDAQFTDPVDVDEAAALWLQRLGEPNVGRDVIVEFEAWRNAGRSHAEAFARVVAAWDAIDEHAAAPEILNLRKDALDQAQWLAMRRPEPRRRSPAIAAAFAAAIALGAAGLYFLYPAPRQSAGRIYASEIGERKIIYLEDGSRIEMDADSQVSVAFTPGERHLQVLRGQAFFQVAKDRARPFVVEANRRDVVATGTSFDVEAIADGLQVALVEGHVIVRNAGASHAADAVLAALSPGDELTVQSGRAPALVHHADMLTATAWRQGKLVFDDVPLADAVAQLQRYSHQKIAADRSVAALRVSGVFDVGDLAGFAVAVEHYYPVAAVFDRNRDLTLVRRRR
jgi:transmembrane sensor